MRDWSFNSCYVIRITSKYHSAYMIISLSHWLNIYQNWVSSYGDLHCVCLNGEDPVKTLPWNSYLESSDYSEIWQISPQHSPRNIPQIAKQECCGNSWFIGFETLQDLGTFSTYHFKLSAIVVTWSYGVLLDIKSSRSFAIYVAAYSDGINTRKLAYLSNKHQQ